MPGYDPASMFSFPPPLFTFDFSLVTILRLSTCDYPPPFPSPSPLFTFDFSLVTILRLSPSAFRN